MFMGFMALVIICSAPLLGGRLKLLASLRLRHSWLILVALGVQIVITDVYASGPRPLLVALHLASYAAAGMMLWVNRKLPGLLIIGVGAVLNAGVIALNGGTLPASAHALAVAGLPTDAASFANSGVLDHPVLPWLGDIVATPAWLPFRNVISVGDLIILIGVGILVNAVTRSHLAGHSSPSGRHRQSTRSESEQVGSAA